MAPIFDLHLKSLCFPAAKEPVLKDIHFAVEKGEFVAVAGKPASGKSIFLHTLTGAAMKFHGGVLDGTVSHCGREQKDIPLPQICQYIGFMSQEPQNQIVSVTVEEEVAFGIANMGLSPKEISRRVRETLAYVGLDGMEKRQTTALSGGQAQRLVLASVLAMDAPILILDQPAAELDLAGKEELYHHIRRLNREKGVTVIMVMDSGMSIPRYADRIIIMDQGTIVKNSPASQGAGEKDEIIVPAFAVKDNALASLKNVSYEYKGGIVGCENICFDVREGDFFVIMGKNAAALRQQVGFLFQNPDFQIFCDTVKEEAAFGLRNSAIPFEEKERRVAELLEIVNLAALANIHPQKLSRSQRQKLALASALVHEPKLLIADEPTAGLSEEDSRAMMNLLTEFRLRGGTVVLVSHDPLLIKSYANTILVLEHHKMAGFYRREHFSDIPQGLLYQGGDGLCG